MYPGHQNDNITLGSWCQRYCTGLGIPSPAEKVSSAGICTSIRIVYIVWPTCTQLRKQFLKDSSQSEAKLYSLVHIQVILFLNNSWPTCEFPVGLRTRSNISAIRSNGLLLSMVRTRQMCFYVQCTHVITTMVYK